MTAVDNPLVDEANKYLNEFRTTTENLRIRGITAKEKVQQLAQNASHRLTNVQQEVQPQVTEMQTKVVESVKDMGPLDNPPSAHKFILEVYLWTAVCLIGLSSGQLLGRFLLPNLIASVFDTWVTIFLAYIIIPIWFYTYTRKNQDLSVEDRRMGLFGVSILLGILMGYNLAHLHLTFFSPPAFILPLTVALIAGQLGSVLGPNRTFLLGGTIGSAVLVYLVLGILSKSLGASYLLWVLVSAGAAAVNLQILLAQMKDGKADPLLLQLAAVVTSLLVQSLMERMFGTTAKKAQVAATSEQHQQQAAKRR